MFSLLIMLHTNNSFLRWKLPWKCIWKTKLLRKWFVWLLAKGACLKHDNHQKREVKLCGRCLLCNNEAEDINPLFLHSTFTSQIRSSLFNLLGIKLVMPRTSKDLLQFWHLSDLGKIKRIIWNTSLQWYGGLSEIRTDCESF